MSIESDTQGMYLQPTARMVTMAEMNPLQVVTQDTEMLRHVEGFEGWWVNGRDEMIHSYPQIKTFFRPIMGRTGSGKRLLISEAIALARHDPILTQSLAEWGVPLRVVYLPFCDSVNLGTLRGQIDPSTPKGLFSKQEYRSASNILTEYTLRELANFEGPTLVFLEPSGPSATITPEETIEGWDRGLSTLYLLSKYHREETRTLVVQRDAGVADKIVAVRKALLEASPQEMAEIIMGAHLKITKKGQPDDIRKWSRSALVGLQKELISSMASWKGVLQSNDQMDQMIWERYGTRNENDFWPLFFDNLGFTSSDYVIAKNPYTEEDFAYLLDLLDECNPMIDEIKMRQRLAALTNVLQFPGKILQFPGKLVNSIRRSA